MHIQHQDKEFSVQRKDASTLIVNGQEIDLSGSSDSKIILNGKEYNVELVEDKGGSKKIYINNLLIDYEVKTDLEHKLDQMGIVAASAMKASEIIAPMPGKIVDVMVEKGQSISEGEVVLILEAMKMENAIKVAFDAEIKDVLIKKGDTVEKGQKMVLLS